MNNKSTIDPLETAKFARLSANWWDAEGPLKTLHHINPVRLEFIRHQVDISGRRVLDVGCGGGILSEALAGAGALVTGIDADPGAIAAASAHAEAQGLAVEYQATAIEDFEAPPFDVITCMELLEHVEDPQLLITHCVRLLRPGGFLLVSTINRTPKAWFTAVIAAEYILRLLPRQTHDYHRFIKPAELAGMGRQAGLEMTGIKGMAYHPLTGSATLTDSVAVNYLLSFSALA
jgi:2-polyprenyl-6-hydroxyphenyl methylase / 3-demethylubiquinone-9 3-methyltransferase